MTESKELSSDPQTGMGPGAIAPVKPTSSRSTEFWAAALAVLFYALLVDAAVETFLSGSPVRWWVAGVVAAFLSVSAGVLSRGSANWFGWSRRATVSFFVLLALLAATVWLPGGLTNGMALLRQPTSVVVPAVSALAVAFAGIALVRVKSVPLSGRAALGALTLYGVAAFVLGIIDGAAYPALFRGESFWQRLPYWLQGAFVGSFIIIPVALIFKALYAPMKVGIAAFNNWGLHQVIALALSLVTALSAVTPRAGLREVQPSGQVVTRMQQGAHPLTQVAETRENLWSLTNPTNLPLTFDLLDKLQSASNQPAFDVTAKAKDLGPDVDKVFEFVRDHVRFEAYEGVLRGAGGALVAMAGNSYDKSLLLGALLSAHGIEVRYVRGHLTDERSAALVGQMFENARSLRTRVVSRPEAVPPIAAAAAESFSDAVIARWFAAADVVRPALERDKIRFSQSPPASVDALRVEAQDHVWAEYRAGERWIALDSTIKGSRPGDTFASGSETWNVIPASLHHRVLIRVVGEQRVAGEILSSEVLRYEAAAHQLHGSNATLRYEITPDVGVGWSAAPILQIDGQRIRGQIVAGTGMAAGAEALAKGLFGRPGQPPRARGAATEAIAEWLEFTFTYPSGRPSTIRREVFDRIGPSARTGGRIADAELAAVPEVNGIPAYLRNIYGFSFASGLLHPAVAGRRLAQHSSAVRRALPVLSRVTAAGATPTTADAQELGTTLGPILPDLLSYVAASFYVMSQSGMDVVRATRPPGEVCLYEATPRLAIVSVEHPGDHGGVQDIPVMSLDLRRNDVRVVTAPPRGDLSASLNLWRGLLDGAIEHSLFGDLGQLGETTPVSTVAIFERATVAGIGIGTITTGEQIERLQVPDATKARMHATLADGVTLVSPLRTVSVGGKDRLGWWRIDGSTGETLAVMDTGLHQAVERSAWEVLGPSRYIQLAVYGFVRLGILVGAVAWVMFQLGYVKGTIDERVAQERYRQESRGKCAYQHWSCETKTR